MQEILTDRLVIGDRRVTVELGGDRRLARVTVHRDNIWLDRFQRRQGCNGHNASSRQRASNASDGPRQLFGALGRRKLVTFPACRDRKSVVSGKSVSVRVDLGGRRNLKKKNKI